MNVEILKAGYWINKFWSFLLSLKFGTNISADSSLFFIGILLFLFVFLYFLRKIIIIRKSIKESSVLLELIPPAVTEKESYTTQQLFSFIHALGSQRSFKNRLLGYKTRFSLEIVSTKNDGIRYLVRTTPKEINTLRRSLLSYLPQLKVNTVKEYLPEEKSLKNLSYKVIEFKLSRHFAFPLKKQNELDKHDPIAYITGMMTKLLPGELASFQIILSPTRPNEIKKISKMIFNNWDVLGYLKNSNFILRFFSGVSYNKTPFEQEIIKSVENKINQPLYETSIRVILVFKNEINLSERSQGFISSFATFSSQSFQSITHKKYLNIELIRRYLFWLFRKRLLSFTKNSILSVNEISDIYHFPFTKITKTEDLVKTHSKELPAPLSLKKGNNLDIVFAKNNYGSSITNIGLTNEERLRHVYIIGATGTGKTTMILSMTNQDIQNGKGIAVIDPHGDLAESLLNCIPKERENDLIYFNPDDIKYPIGLNLLELTPGLDEDDMLREKELITESVISLFRKVFSEVWSAHAHRLEYILRNTIQTALTLENPTLFTVYELLTNPDFQKASTRNLEDLNLKNFWTYEFGKAGDYQKVKMIGPITSRVGRFLFSPSAKRIMEQKKSTINFDEILDKGKILICNLSKGKLGEDTSEVLGIMILTKIQLAALKRARVPSVDRTPFHLYVDEFQNFATPSFIQMLSEARKYGINLVMAEQSTSQQKDRNIVNVILANVGTVISFRSANPDDEKIILPQFAPYVEKGEIANLPSFRFYMKVSAISPEEPFSGETIPFDIKTDRKKIEELITLSRGKNAIKYAPPVKPKSSQKKQIQEDPEIQYMNSLT